MTEKILCVDDDDNILAAYRRSLRKQFSIDTVSGGEKGLKRIARDGPYAIVVSDMRMPEMDGIEFLERVQEIAPDTVRMMLTGYADVNTSIEVVNRGNIFRFLTKPCEPKELAIALKAGLKQYRLVMAERNLLSQTLTGGLRTMIDILAAIDPESFGQSASLRDSVKNLAETIKVRNSWEVEITAMLMHIGYVTLPPELLMKMRQSEPLSQAEKNAIRKVPLFSHNLVKNIPRLEPVARSILYQDKNYDGSGFPDDSTAGEDIPVSARILRVLRDYLHEKAKGATVSRAFRNMGERTGRYDPKILERIRAAFERPMRALASVPKERPSSRVYLECLSPGQIPFAAIRTRRGRLLVAPGVPLTGVVIEKLKIYADLKEIEGSIRVRD